MNHTTASPPSTMFETVDQLAPFIYFGSIVSLAVAVLAVHFRKTHQIVSNFLKELLEVSPVDPRDESKTKSSHHGSVYESSLGQNPVVVLSGADVCEEFFTTVKGVHRERALGLGYLFDRFLGDCLGALTGKRWATVKRAFQPAMLKMQSNHSIAVINREIIRWQHRVLDPLVTTGESIDILALVGNMPQRAIQSIFFGEDFVDHHEEKLNELAAMSKTMINEVFLNRRANTWFYRFLSTDTNRTLNTFYKELSEMIQKYDNQDENVQQQGVLYLVNRQKISEKEFLQTVAEILFANLDVSVPSTAWLLVHLALHSDKLDCGYATTPSDELDIDATDPASLNFVNESARIAPIGSLSTQFLSDREMFGYPAGTRYSIDNVSLNRDPKVWENPGTFDPSRFEQDNHGREFAFMRFGMSTRKCPGRHLADVLLSTVLTRCARRYDLQLVSKDIKSSDDAPLHDGWFLAPKVDIRATWRPVPFNCTNFGSTPIFVGISVTPNTPFLEPRNAKTLFDTLSKLGQPVTVILPDTLTRYNIMAFEGKSEKQALKRSLERSKPVFDNLFAGWNALDKDTQERVQLWQMCDLEAAPGYADQLAILRREYDNPGEFHDLLNAVARRYSKLRGRDFAEGDRRLRYAAEYIMGELPILICGIHRPGGVHCTQLGYAAPLNHLEQFGHSGADSMYTLVEKLKTAPGFQDLRDRLDEPIAAPGCVFLPM